MTKCSVHSVCQRAQQRRWDKDVPVFRSRTAVRTKVVHLICFLQHWQRRLCPDGSHSNTECHLCEGSNGFWEQVVGYWLAEKSSQSSNRVSTDLRLWDAEWAYPIKAYPMDMLLTLKPSVVLLLSYYGHDQSQLLLFTKHPTALKLQKNVGYNFVKCHSSVCLTIEANKYKFLSVSVVCANSRIILVTQWRPMIPGLYNNSGILHVVHFRFFLSYINLCE